MDDAVLLTAARSSTEDGSPGSYALHELIRDVPLEPDEDGSQPAEITCVDAWNGNLYIGTSAGHVLHYVSIPPDPSDDNGQPSYIFATRIEPPFAHRQSPPDTGIKQILLLPSVGKACIVCNGTLSFYSLPELSPAFDGRIRQIGCLWVGGIDRNEQDKEVDSTGGVAVAICLKQRVRMIRIGDVAHRIRDVELGGISAIERRGNLSCVASGNTYSLLDVVNQLQNGLFPISSSSDPEPVREEPIPNPSHSRQDSTSRLPTSPSRQDRNHERNTSSSSTGTRARNNDRLHPDDGTSWPARNSSRPALSPASSSEEPHAETSAGISAPTSETATQAETPQADAATPLMPNILSPTPDEFLLTTGTKWNEPGVGVFVNLDGDVVRGTIEFSSYPRSVVLDTATTQPYSLGEGEAASEGYVLAVVQREIAQSMHTCIEIQRWDVDPSEANRKKEWLTLPDVDAAKSTVRDSSIGLRLATSVTDLHTPKISSSLRLRRLYIQDEPSEISHVESQRNLEEDRLAARFAQIRASVLAYTNAQVAWVARNPLVLTLDQQLESAVTRDEKQQLVINTDVVQHVFNSMRGQEPQNELEFLTLTYIRQKASLLLFGKLILQAAKLEVSFENDKRHALEALSDGTIDPRIILTLVPLLSNEIAEGEGGIWMPQGLRDTAEMLRRSVSPTTQDLDPQGPYGDNILSVLKLYLTTWRKKKGFGSVADETHVTQTVDAALLHTLLILDQHSPRGPAVAGTIRAELNELVDQNVECFDRAVQLFEQYHRLYMLSRLYQSRKMTTQVLSTWRRILDGDHDAGGELTQGEQSMRGYLTKIRDAALVQEYGSWLAHRNPRLGVQVFADDTSRVKFAPTEAVAILRTKAPGAVKDYLEHLVFAKNHPQYANDLITFYLDSVLHELESSPESRALLLATYDTYRSLEPPKPTYRQFITDNALDAEWWHNRLRLLQLLGASPTPPTSYDMPALAARLAPYPNALVPETIILHSHHSAHPQALHLLTHALADYDTAIRYCLLGGSPHAFHPSSPASQASLPPPSHATQSQLFTHLLDEFLQIPSLAQRIPRVAELLERFGPWFDFAHVLSRIPDDWPVEVLAAFVVHALRRLVRERNEALVVRALATTQNLRQTLVWVEKCEAQGPRVVEVSEGVGVGGGEGEGE